MKYLAIRSPYMSLQAIENGGEGGDKGDESPLKRPHAWERGFLSKKVYIGRPRGFSPNVHIGIGMLFVCAAKATSAIVEIVRRSKAVEEVFEDQPNAIIDMSALWLVSEFLLFGMAEAFTPVGQVEFFYYYFPKTMSSFAMAIFTLELAVGDAMGSALVNIVDKVTSIGGNESLWAYGPDQREKLEASTAGQEDEQFGYWELPTS